MLVEPELRLTVTQGEIPSSAHVTTLHLTLVPSPLPHSKLRKLPAPKPLLTLVGQITGKASTLPYQWTSASSCCGAFYLKYLDAREGDELYCSACNEQACPSSLEEAVGAGSGKECLRNYLNATMDNVFAAFLTYSRWAMEYEKLAAEYEQNYYWFDSSLGIV